MFEKLAEDIEKRYWQKLAALEKEAAKWKGSVADPSLAMLKRQQGAMSKIDPYSKSGFRSGTKPFFLATDADIDDALKLFGQDAVTGDSYTLIRGPVRNRPRSTGESKGIMGDTAGRAALDTFLHSVSKEDSDFMRKVIRETSNKNKLSEDDFNRLKKMQAYTEQASPDGLDISSDNVFHKIYPNIIESGESINRDQVRNILSNKDSGDIFSRRGNRANAVGHLTGANDVAFFSPPEYFDNGNSVVKGDYVGLISKSKSKPVMTEKEFMDSFHTTGNFSTKNPKIRRYMPPGDYEAVIQKPALQKALKGGSAAFFKQKSNGSFIPISAQYPDQRLAGIGASNIEAPTVLSYQVPVSGRAFKNEPQDITELIRKIVNNHPINYYKDDSFLQNIPYDRFLP